MSVSPDEQPATDPQLAEAPGAGAQNVPPGGSAAAAREEPLAGINDMVREIRERLTDISSRELELRRREKDFERQYRRLEVTAREAAERDATHDRERLVRERAEMRERAAEVAGRRLQLDEREQHLRSHEQEVERRREQLAEQADLIQRRLERHQQRLRQQRDTLRNRIRVVRGQETELARRILLARGEISGQRTDLERRQTELQARVARLEEAERSLAGRQAELDQRHRSDEAAAADIKARQQELRDARARLEQQRRDLEKASRELAEGQAALVQRQREYDQRWQQTHGQQHELARQTEELASRRRMLQQEHAAVIERQQRLDQRERQLGERAAQLETEKRQLEEAQSELEQRRQDIEKMGGRAAALEQQAQHLQDEAAALRERAEAREAESRQAALSLEVEREKLESEAERLTQQRAALATSAQTIEARHAERERQLQRSREELVQLAQRLRSAERAGGGAGRYWWARSTAVALVASALAMAAVLAIDRPQFRAATSLQITTEADSAAAALARHRNALLAAELLAKAGVPEEIDRGWRAACAEGRVSVSLAGDVPDEASAGDSGRTLRLSLQVTDDDARRARQLAAAACAAHADRLNAVVPEERLLVELEALTGWREELEQERRVVSVRHARDALALAACPDDSERDRCLAEADRLERSLAQTTAELQARRSTLATLVSVPLPRGALDPGRVDAAVEADTIHREDVEESRAVALRYRTELAISMLLLVDPAKSAQRTIAQYAATVSEQRELAPPPAIGTVLEACAARLERADERLSEFLEHWQASIERVQALSVDRDVVRLVKQQGEASDEARRAADGLVELVDDLGRQIESLSADGEGSTREVVVGAVLRSDHAMLETAVESVLSAAGKMALSENFELDTQDRQLRGLCMRLEQRRASIEQGLQLEADREAQREHGARIERLRGEIQQLEERREQALIDLSAALRSRRSLDEAAQRRAALEQANAQSEARLAWLTARIDDLDRQLDAARRQGIRPDRIEPGETTGELLDTARYRNAGLAGGGAFIATWLVCLLMVARAPWQRRQAAAVAARIPGPQSENPS